MATSSQRTTPKQRPNKPRKTGRVRRAAAKSSRTETKANSPASAKATPSKREPKLSRCGPAARGDGKTTALRCIDVGRGAPVLILDAYGMGRDVLRWHCSRIAAPPIADLFSCRLGERHGAF